MSQRLRNIRIYAVMAVIGVLPIAAVLLAGSIATAQGCILHEGAIAPCFVWGHDIGAALHLLTVMGWLMLVTNLFLIAGLGGLLWEGLRALTCRLWRNWR